MSFVFKSLCLLLLLSINNYPVRGALFGSLIPGFSFPPGFPRLGQGEQQQQQPQPQERGFIEPKSIGAWQIVSPNSGVSAMHMQLMPNNKVIMFDATSLGKSEIQLRPGNCRLIPEAPGVDCWAHAVEFDTDTAQVKTLKVISDPWCSSGGLDPSGTLVSTGGWRDGEKSLRFIDSCPTCDWRENIYKLADNRWYATQIMLADGRFVVIGGRRSFNYEFVPREGEKSLGRIDLPFLRETTDIYENNLYPFVHLAPDGNLFILANNRAILLDPLKNKILRNYPDLPGGARNYPGSACTAILPIHLQEGVRDVEDIEVLVCGGGQPDAYGKAEKQQIYIPALESCGKIKVMDANPQWEMDKMPSPRVMGDMLNLPNGQILIINGAKKGASGWQFADEPNLTPLLYSPDKIKGKRFRQLKPTQIPRMYHSSSSVLPDGEILVAGSNTNPAYEYNVKFQTELRAEKFSPPYLHESMDQYRPDVDTFLVPKVSGYGQMIVIPFRLPAGFVEKNDIMVTMLRPPFTTHGYSMNQRLLDLAIKDLVSGILGTYSVVAEAPLKGEIAPPGHYLIFVNYKGVPSQGSWIKLG